MNSDRLDGGLDECTGAPSFDRHIRLLFRPQDIHAMRRFFDLASLTAVQEHAASILERLEAGSMPCDRMWTEDAVDLFRCWMDNGMRP